MNKNGNIILIGMPGSGKTEIGKALSHRLRRLLVDIDFIIENENNMTISHIFSEYGEEYFRGIETKKAGEVSSFTQSIISTGGGIVTRPENMQYLKKSGAVFFINRSLENIISCLNTSNRPLLKNDSENSLKKLYNDRIKLYNDYADFIIPNDQDMIFAVDDIENIVRNEGL